MIDLPAIRWLMVVAVGVVSTWASAPGVADGIPPAVLIAAGDVGACAGDGDEATARLLDGLLGETPGATVALLGDTTDGEGSLEEIERCFGEVWGRHNDRIRPVPGNHDYQTPGAAGYVAYFGSAAGSPGEGWYAYDLGSWRVIALNSNCEAVGGCGVGAPQGRWLAAELAARPSGCTLAYWHHPRFTGGQDGDALAMAAIWAMLADAGAEVVLSGHTHAYERFAPLDRAGEPDTARGMRQLVAGTGGAELHPIHEPREHAEVVADEVHGLLRLELGDGRYSWEFVPVAGETPTDQGVGACR